MYESMINHIMKEVKIVEIKSEIGAGTRGASLGIDALKVASLNKGSDFFSHYPRVSVKTENQVLFEENPFPFAKFISSIYQIELRIMERMIRTFEEGFFPIVLAGDHSNAAGTLAGIKATYPDKRIGTIWIDAHADIHSPYTTPSGNVHGMPLAIALNEDNLSSKINLVDHQTIEYWEKLKNVGIPGAKLAPQDLIFIAVRETEEPEDFLIQQYQIPNISVAEIRQIGIQATVQKSLDYLQDCDLIYISFDVDSIDASISSGTGTPVKNGLTPAEAKELNNLFIQQDKIVCWEMVEVNPTLDRQNSMAEIAFGILESTTQAFEKAAKAKVMA